MYFKYSVSSVVPTVFVYVLVLLLLSQKNNVFVEFPTVALNVLYKSFLYVLELFIILGVILLSIFIQFVIKLLALILTLSLYLYWLVCPVFSYSTSVSFPYGSIPLSTATVSNWLFEHA